ncbi:MAG: DMT family transporter [Desulfuromonadales bacterium]|nr:DMT family transporter [Desulfuromonadales bacterium]
MTRETLKADTLLLTTAAIWGFAFVAKRVGMEHLGPFTYSAARFGLGCLSLLPLLIYVQRNRPGNQNRERRRVALTGGIAAGTVLFLGASLQQVGLTHTTAGNAGFITSLYVVIVPLLGLFSARSPRPGTWFGALLAAFGLYFLCLGDGLHITSGDLLVLIGAFFWAGHVLLIGRYAPQTDSLWLAAVQFAVCSLLSLIIALCHEVITLEALWQASLPILYGGLGSVGIAYTLQVIAQRDSHPAHSAVIMSLEGLFAAVGGWLLLNEQLSARGMFGCALMLVGILLSQGAEFLTRKTAKLPA